MNKKTKISNYSLYKRNFLSDDLIENKESDNCDVAKNPSLAKRKMTFTAALMR